MLKRYPVLILILFLAVGYAGISTKHLIDGSINVAYDENFSIIFNSIDTYYGAYTLNNDKNSFDFKTISLKNLKDEALLEFDIINKSTNYDANVSINCALKESSVTLSQYLEITNDLTNTYLVESGENITGHLVIKMKKNYTGSTGITPEITCSLTKIPISRTEKGEINVSQYKDPVLNGADPVVKGKLIPVKLSMNGTATYADKNQKWYSYQNKEWANAVILVDSPSKTYKVGDIIKENDIESYFVWIPRYKYLIFDTGNYSSYINSNPPTTSNAQEIQIEFESKEMGASYGTTKGSWRTHPAFTNYNTNGLWVGKFKTGYKGATTITGAEQNTNNAAKVIIKPNTYMWRGITVSNMFKTSLNYESSLTSHMMRNTEWGSVAYLSNSKYGINDEVRINNNSNLLTGYAANEKDAGQSTTNNSKYNTETGYKASTTGNITGIYDLSGGCFEYVAGYRANTTNSSGFSASELTNYSAHLDVYPSNSDTSTYNYRILGDATGEMGPFYKSGEFYINNWYGDNSYFVSSTAPWIRRGGTYDYGSRGGQFHFGRNNGGAANNNGFRITLAPS